MALEIGKKAPDFSLLSDEGKLVKLSDFLGQRIVLYFYPKDDTSGCTKEACEFSERLPQFLQSEAVIIGVSKDSVTAHQAFKKKYQLKHILLADTEGTTCEAYGVWVEKSMYGKKYKGIERTTFLIDETGKISQIWSKVKVPDHAAAVLTALQ